MPTQSPELALPDHTPDNWDPGIPYPVALSQLLGACAISGIHYPEGGPLDMRCGPWGTIWGLDVWARVSTCLCLGLISVQHEASLGRK